MQKSATKSAILILSGIVRVVIKGIMCLSESRISLVAGVAGQGHIFSSWAAYQ